MNVPTSTYRLQVRPGFDLIAVAAHAEYLTSLGAGALYLSPLLPAVHGSDHGYDVIGFDTVDPQRGGADGWARLRRHAEAHGLGIVVDIVPNHTGVADAAQNLPWWDVLRHGRGSPYARWFDIDWDRGGGRLLLPVLGDDFTPEQLSIQGDELRYAGLRFPLAPGTGPAQDETAAAVHDRQHYQLVAHRRADTDQNYRRFFAVSSLAGLRVEDPVVFEATHAQIRRWCAEDGVTGLRVDHPDGLADPAGYLARLRELAGPQTWIIVEKILQPGEPLPRRWPVDGTTGYDALGEVTNLFIDPAASAELTAGYRQLTGDDRDFGAHAAAGKRYVATTILRAEVDRLARLAADLPLADEAVLELLVAFPVYRSYVPDGRGYLSAALEAASAARPDLAETINALAARLSDPNDELSVRFQQTSAAVMGKGVEDTAFYRYTRFIAVNEVGSDPARTGWTPEQFHEAQGRRQQHAPQAMTTLSTHDTKRSEDVRARLAVLPELAAEWTALAGSLLDRAPIADRPLAYLLWQSFAGAGFIERDRTHAYAEKAMREASVHTGWREPRQAFESTVHAMVDRAYDDPDLHEPLATFIERITPHGWSNSLGQKLVQLTMPGAPDVYQGSELWEYSLVDPDNRRPVEFTARAALLARLDSDGMPPPIDASGAAKLWLVSRALRLRRARPELFTGYTPVRPTGAAAAHAVVFDRGGAITVATRLPVRLRRSGGWRDTTVTLEGAFTDVLTCRSHTGRVALRDLLSAYPVALLARPAAGAVA